MSFGYELYGESLLSLVIIFSSALIVLSETFIDYPL